MRNLFYVYILQSEKDRERYYVGLTADPESRLSDHNLGKCVAAREYRPWKIKNIIGFDDKQKALAFERYLKSGSGRAFAKRRF